jgi:hypothetical protein
MAKIHDYSAPESSAQAGSVSSGLELENTGGVDKAIAGLGRSIQEVGAHLYRRQAQTEVSDLNAKFSEARADWAQKIDDGVRNGEIDAVKTTEEFQDYINNLNQNISTPEGRNFFTSQAARLGSFVTRGAAKGQAAVAGAKAEGAWRSSLDNNSSVLLSDPSSFKDTLDSTIEAVDAQVATGALEAKHGEKLKHETGVELAKSAVRGWAQLDPDLATKKLDSGEFDQYFSGDVKAQMQGYIHQQIAAKEIEERRAEAAQKRAQEAAGEAWQQKALPELAKGSLETQKILDSPMSAEKKIHWLKLADQATKEATQSDPRVKNELTRRILLPDDDPQKIRDISDLAPYAGRGVSVQDVEQLSGFINKLPEGKALQDNRKKMLDYATARLAKKNAFGMSDPKGEYNLSQFMVDLQQQEAAFRKEGKNVADLYNPHSKDYYGLQADKFIRDQMTVMKDNLQYMRKASIKDNVDFNKKEEVSMPKKPGEIPDDWLKRKRESKRGVGG